MTKKLIQRDKYLQKKYGITLAQYDVMLAKQNDCCALCGKHKSLSKHPLHVEHNHRSGKIRSLCCYYCNRRRIGQLTLEWAKKLVEYFEKYDG